MTGNTAPEPGRASLSVRLEPHRQRRSYRIHHRLDRVDSRGAKGWPRVIWLFRGLSPAHHQVCTPYRLGVFSVGPGPSRLHRQSASPWRNQPAPHHRCCRSRPQRPPARSKPGPVDSHADPKLVQFASDETLVSVDNQRKNDDATDLLATQCPPSDRVGGDRSESVYDDLDLGPTIRLPVATAVTLTHRSRPTPHAGVSRRGPSAQPTQ